MKYFLDTDILIYFLKGEKKVVDKISKQNPLDLATTIINHSELLYGAYNSAKKKENLSIVKSLLKNLHVLHFCEESSTLFAENKAFLKKQGTPIADLDLMIASIAQKHKATLVTNNTKHFLRIKNLKLENWTT